MTHGEKLTLSTVAKELWPPHAETNPRGLGGWREHPFALERLAPFAGRQVAGGKGQDPHGARNSPAPGTIN